MFLSPDRGRGRVGVTGGASPPHPTSPPVGGEEYELLTEDQRFGVTAGGRAGATSPSGTLKVSVVTNRIPS